MRLRPLLLAGSTALVAISGLAWAQAAPPPPAAPPPAAAGTGDDRMHRMRAMNPKAMCQDHVARRIGNRAYLKARLELKPEQMSAWNAFEKAADAASSKDLARCASLPAEMKTPPTYTERLAMQEERLKARLESIQSVKPSLETLYAALTPEQQALFDRPRGHRHGPR